MDTLNFNLGTPPADQDQHFFYPHDEAIFKTENFAH